MQYVLGEIIWNPVWGHPHYDVNWERKFWIKEKWTHFVFSSFSGFILLLFQVSILIRTTGKTRKFKLFFTIRWKIIQKLLSAFTFSFIFRWKLCNFFAWKLDSEVGGAYGVVMQIQIYRPIYSDALLHFKRPRLLGFWECKRVEYWYHFHKTGFQGPSEIFQIRKLYFSKLIQNCDGLLEFLFYRISLSGFLCIFRSFWINISYVKSLLKFHFLK